MHAHGPKIEAGQILNPECFPPPTELVMRTGAKGI